MMVVIEVMIVMMVNSGDGYCRRDAIGVIVATEVMVANRGDGSYRGDGGTDGKRWWMQ